MSRGYVDGCFDIMHSGHYNCIRQAKAICDVLVVGVHSDDEIARNKAIPVMTQAERYGLLEHIKWADEILHDVPYSPALATLERARAEFCVHGDDMPRNAEGYCAYDHMADAGKLRIVKRTEGVSTTDLVGRLLTLTAARNDAPDAELMCGKKASELKAPSGCSTPEKGSVKEALEKQSSPVTLMLTTRRIAEFSSRRSPSDTDVVVYVAGDFDLFNVSHARLLQKAKSFGTFLLVGVWDDNSAALQGPGSPVMNLHERVLNVSACKHADDVLMGAPQQITKELIVSMGINVVVEARDPQLWTKDEWFDEAKARDCYQAFDVDMPIISVEDVAQRIIQNRATYVQRNQKRGAVEAKFYEERGQNSAVPLEA